MSTTQAPSATGSDPKAKTVGMKLEVITIPVSDADRAKRFYGGLGWRLDADIAAENSFRLVQFTPRDSSCSIQFGRGLTTAGSGSAQRVYLVVADIEAARAELIAHGVDVGEVFHLGGPEGRQSGPDPAHASYASFASFSDPDGNGWLLQEVSVRLPGRVEADDTTFRSSSELAGALRRAEAAHGQHEKRTGQRDENWADWYADYIVREQAGGELPFWRVSALLPEASCWLGSVGRTIPTRFEALDKERQARSIKDCRSEPAGYSGSTGCSTT